MTTTTATASPAAAASATASAAPAAATTRSFTVSGGRLAAPEAHPGFRFGVGLRRRHFEPLLEGPALPGLDFFEVIPENYLGLGGLPRRALREARSRVPVVTHGISLNVGGHSPLDEDYLRELSILLGELDAPWHSDHVCISGAHGIEYHDLLPVPMDRGTLGRMATRATVAAARLRRPLLLENPTVYARLPGGELSEPAFLRELVETSGCKLLLDLNNVWVNCLNHGGDPVAYLEALPPDCVGQFHLAGYRPDEPLAIDSHGAPVCDEVRELYRVALRRFGPAWTLLERDANIPPLEELLDELSSLRADAHAALTAPEVTISLPSLGPEPSPIAGDPETGLARLHEVVLGASPEDAAQELGLEVTGLRLYRNFFRRHHREILSTAYRVLFSALPDDVVERLVREYQATHPMSEREINANAAAFPGWLATRAEAGDPDLGEFHVELALLERQRFEAYSDPQELPGPEATPTLNPTLRVLEVRYPLASWLGTWSAALASGEPKPEVPAPGDQPEILLVCRDPDSLHARVVRGTPPLLFALKMLHEGLGPAEAGAQAGRDATFALDALEQARAHGVVIGS